MGLSNDLISLFAKTTNDNTESKKDTIVYGTIKEEDGSKWVQIDGSELLTPIESTTNVKDGDRVTVEIKNHTAIVTGNISDPSATNDDVDNVINQVSDFEIVVADKVYAVEAQIEKLRADAITTDNLEAINASINELEAKNVIITETLTAKEADIEKLKTDKLDVTVANITYATIDTLNATNATINNLEATYGDFEELTTRKFEAVNATIENLDATYANIDFSNIGKATMESFYANSGLIKDVVIGDSTITGELVGVTISGDLIKGNTIVADKLVIRGEDGIYYKLNSTIEGVTSEQLSTEEYQNKLHGDNIIANTITASKIDVEDLVAFDATIGGFKISDNAIYSGVKESIDNTTRGIYLDNTGQMVIGDSSNYLKYYKDKNGKYRLVVSAESICFGPNSDDLESSMTDLQNGTITSTVEEFYQSTSATSLDGGEWLTSQPTWTNGTYIWRRTLVTHGDGTTEYTPSENGVCITGNTGANGANGKDGQSSINLYTGSFDFSGDNWVNIGAWIVSDETDSLGNKIASKQSPWGGIYQKIPADAGDVFTLSANIRSTNGFKTVIFYTSEYDDNGTQLYGEQVFTYGMAPTKETRVKATYKVRNACKLSFRIENSVSGANDTLYISSIKLERGAPGVTDWCISPNDIKSGIGVSSVDIYYYSSTSNTKLEGGEWSTDAPDWANSRYIWSKTVTSYTDGNITESSAVCITGAKGSDGDNGEDGKMLYATCSTLGATADKVATLSSGTLTLASGVTVAVKFTYSNTASSPTLNISGTGPKQIRLNGAALTTSTHYWVANAVVTFVYDGSYWNIIDASYAAKTATNFMYHDATNGLQIGNKSTGSWSGYRAQITNESFNILNQDGNAMAIYGANSIELGNNSEDTVISLCKGRGQIKAENENLGLEIEAPFVTLNGKAGGTRMCSKLIRKVYDNYYTTRRSDVAVRTTSIQMNVYQYESDSDGNSIGSVSDGSSISIDTSNINIEHAMSVIVNAPTTSFMGDTGVTGHYYDNQGQKLTNGLTVYTGSGTAAIDPNTTLETLILTDKNTPDTGFWYINTMFYSKKEAVGNKAQVAIPYNTNKGIYFRYKYNNTWSGWLKQKLAIEDGVSGVWHYTKWSDGTAKIWGAIPYTGLSISTAMGSLYRSSNPFTPNSHPLPFTMASDASVYASHAPSNGVGAFAWVAGWDNKANPPSIYLVRHSSSTGANGTVFITIEGKYA